jgi:hypothetical protein
MMEGRRKQYTVNRSTPSRLRKKVFWAALSMMNTKRNVKRIPRPYALFTVIVTRYRALENRFHLD